LADWLRKAHRFLLAASAWGVSGHKVLTCLDFLYPTQLRRPIYCNPSFPLPSEPPVAQYSSAERHGAVKGAPVCGAAVANPGSRVPFCDCSTETRGCSRMGIWNLILLVSSEQVLADFLRSSVRQTAVRPLAVVFHRPALDLLLLRPPASEPVA
jgi:hypothetical protein